jgi:L-threonylcarbamoyladenylate synthase
MVDQVLINEAAGALRRGELVVAPTETTYGLLARADSDAALKRLYDAKQRPDAMPTALFVRSIDELHQFADLSNDAIVLAKEFLPGPLTIVAKPNCTLPSQVIGLGTIGLRISPEPIIDALLEQIDFPVTATSANISGASNGSDPETIRTELSGHIALLIDVGIRDNEPSTVVDCTSNEIRIIRLGAIDEEQIRLVLRGNRES